MERKTLKPVWKEINVDLETPVSAFLKLKSVGAKLLLESVEKGEELGRYSFIGFAPSKMLKIVDNKIELDGEKIHFEDNEFLEALRKLIFIYEVESDIELPPLIGGWIGYLGYDIVRFFESIKFRKKPSLNLPDGILYLIKEILVFDHLKHSAKIITLKGPDETQNEALKKIDNIIKNLDKPLNFKVEKKSEKKAPQLNFDRIKFKKKVEKIKDYILAGDIFQAVISERIKGMTEVNPFQIYRALRAVNPSPYMFYIDFNDFHLIGSSPETLVKLHRGLASVHPIAGTRPRGKTKEEELKLEKELFASEKEIAEHVMLVDLARNDLGKVCLPNSIKLKEKMNLEKYSHVMHIVSEVIGTLSPKFDALDLFKATFPAGTVSGAPKIRAMEIIEELEEVKRGPYAGAVGYFALDGNMDMCITIRTIIYKKGNYYLQAGAGIVADSDPEREYKEILNKMQGLYQAIKSAEEG